MAGAIGDNPPPSACPDQSIYETERLPERWTRPLQNVPILLGGKEDYKLWKFNVNRALILNNCPQLIDKNIPRPAPESQYYERWRIASLQVAIWLMLQCTENIQDQIINGPHDDVFADDLFDTISKIANKFCINQAKVASFQLASCQRDNYNTAEDYISDFQRMNEHCLKLGIDTGACYQSLILLANLRNDLPIWVGHREYIYADKDPSSFTWTGFRLLCEDAISKAQAETPLNALHHQPAKLRYSRGKS